MLFAAQFEILNLARGLVSGWSVRFVVGRPRFDSLVASDRKDL